MVEGFSAFAAANVGEILLASTALSAVSFVSQGLQAKQQADFQADLADRDAELATRAAAFQEERLRERTRQLIGTQIVQGGQLEGTSLLAITETAEDAELDALAIRFSGSASAANSIAEASLRRLEGRRLRTAGFIGAGNSLLTGAGRFGLLQREQDALKA